MGSPSHEIFAVYDVTNQVVGTAPRPEVHARGLYHRAVHVLIFNSRGALLLQRRTAAKDVCPNLWDLSCGEHLQPGETFEQAAQRGVSEELGVRGIALQRLRPAFLRRFAAPELGILDCEFVELWQGRYDGPLLVDPDEVSETRFTDLATLQADLRRHPQWYTPWLRDELMFLVGAERPHHVL